MDTQKIKKDFPIFSRRVKGKQIVYFDNAATSQKPKQVIDAIVDYYTNHNANIYRGAHTLSDESGNMYEKARKDIASFINATKNELVFVKNSTEALNLVMNSWGMENIKKGDKIVVSKMEHHANLIPWQVLCKIKKAKLEYMNFNEEGLIPESEYDKIKGAKFVGLVHVSNVLGTVNPVKKFCALAKKEGAISLIDSSQGVPHLPVDVRDIGCDFLAFTGHKMLGPMGIGGLYMKKEIGKNLNPFLYGGGMIESVDFYDSIWAETPKRFEAGTPDVAGVVGLQEAVKYLKKVGLKKIMNHENKLIEHTLQKFEKINKIKLYGPLKNRSGVISFTFDGWNVRDLADKLNKKCIAVRAGTHCAQPLHRHLGIGGTCRASYYMYNSIEEIDKMIQILRGL
ncbi:SufS family cysteine desulfurase [Candidatus Micrarchaeota archaeon]|nr:SufS family cysteine desulfurase [Candidatus Micrarchaeota archaeon]